MAIKGIQRGFSLIEIIVVIGLFSIVAVITTQVILRTIANTSTSNSSTRARENLENALSVVERSIRGSHQISCVSTTRVEFLNPNDQLESLECSSAGNGNLFYNSQPLVSGEIVVNECSLACVTTSGHTAPNGVNIVLSGKDLESAYNVSPIRLQTTVYNRSY